MTSLSSPYVVLLTSEQELTELATTVVVAESSQPYLAVYNLEVANGTTRNIDMTFRLSLDGAPIAPVETINVEPGTHLLQLTASEVGLDAGSHTWRAYATVNVNGAVVYGTNTELEVSALTGLVISGGGGAQDSVLLTAPNGTIYQLQVDNGGMLTVSLAP